MRSTTLFTALIALSPLSFIVHAQSSVTSKPTLSMVPMLTPSAPPVTMAWSNEPTAVAALSSEASSLNAAMQSAMAAMSMEGDMTMSDGSVMSMSATSGMSDMMATGTATASLDSMGSAGRFEMSGYVGSAAIVAGWIGVGLGVLVDMV
ncbi:Nn.00g030640.m01.CDS01 [Neocucurbitaria sp. VM-36]